MDMVVCNKVLFIKTEVGLIQSEGWCLPSSFLENETRFLPWECTHKSVDKFTNVSRNSVGPSLSRHTGYFSRHMYEHPRQGSFNFAILLPARLAKLAASFYKF